MNMIVLALFESQYQKSSSQRIEIRVSLMLIIMVDEIYVWVMLKFI